MLILHTFRAICLVFLTVISSIALADDSGTFSPSIIENAPVIDGSLDDACWKEAKPLGQFNIYDNKGPAKFPTKAFVVCDEENIYIGIKCDDSSPDSVVTKKCLRDKDTFSGDVVEVMLSKDCEQGQYIHLAVNPSGCIYDSMVSGGGSNQDTRWDGQWQAAAKTDKSGWTAELSIPYTTLEISDDTGTTWGINVCREKARPSELSSVLPEGDFHNSKKFMKLEIPAHILERFAWDIVQQPASFCMIDGKPNMIFEVSVKNQTSKPRDVSIRVIDKDDKVVSINKKMLPAGQRTVLYSFPVALEEMIKGLPGDYLVVDTSPVKRIDIMNAAGTKVLGMVGISLPRTCKAIEIDFVNPFSKELINVKPDSIDATIKILQTETDADKAVLTVTLTNQIGELVATKNIGKPVAVTPVSFPAKDLPWGAYTIGIIYERKQTVLTEKRTYPLMPADSARIKILNNLVFELANVNKPAQSVEFMNPRTGWIFISVRGDAGAKFFLDEDSEPVIVCDGKEKTSEAFRLLPIGRHKFRTTGMAKNVIVRAVPELIYGRLAYFPSPEEQGPYDWEFLSKDVLPNCTTVLGHPRVKLVDEWYDKGRRWVDECGKFYELPKRDKSTAQEYAAAYRKNYGLTHPKYSGIFVDEFGGGDFPAIMPVINAIRLLAETEKPRGYSVTPWCLFIPGKATTPFHGSAATNLMAEVVFRAGWKVAYEAYAIEAPNLAEAKREIFNSIIEPVQYWKHAFPDSVQNMILCLCYWHPGAIDPKANHLTYMDMQFQAVATNPEFFGLYGMMEYLSTYARRDSIRWAGQLMRHYCIEGKTDLLGKEPYELKHISNPDFEKGFDGWQITSAKPGSVTTKTIKRYGNFEGRMSALFAERWLDTGDTALLMKRAENKPNVFSQEITGLKPGKLYSIELITGDYDELHSGKSEKTEHAIDIVIDNAELLNGPHEKFVSVYNARLRRVGEQFPQFTGKNSTKPFWFNLHWQVFRAKGTTATLKVYDWASPEKPGGPIGQELLFNFIEIRPYLEENKIQNKVSKE